MRGRGGVGGAGGHGYTVGRSRRRALCRLGCFAPVFPPNPQPKEANVEAYEQLKKIISECEDDVRKALGGNKMAQTRVRKAMQEVKNSAQEIRQAMLDIRDKSKEGSAEGGA